MSAARSSPSRSSGSPSTGATENPGPTSLTRISVGLSWLQRPVQLLERDEADRLVEGAGRVVAGVRARRAERLHLEVADALRPAPSLGLGDERAPDAAPVLLPPDAHDVDLGRARRVLLEAEEAEVRLDGERRERRRVLDVLAGGLLDPEPLGQVAEHGLGDARPLGRVVDLDDLRHGRPVTRMPAWPL